MSTIAGGEIVARMLKAEGVEVVFGIIDGTYFGFYGALGRHGISLVSPRHETSAAHMAGAYARATGKLGVCMASNGPGVANILPGVAVENAEGNRVLLITSCRREGTMYPERIGTYQCIDQVAITRPMTKFAAHVPARDRIPEILRRALRASWEGRPGVVHVDIPESILNGKGDFDDASILEPARYRRTMPVEPSDAEIDQAARMLAEAEAPMIHVGSGVVHAGGFEELRAVAELLGTPVTTSWAARGAIAETSPCAISMIHVELNHRVRNEADLALVIGSRVGETDWWGKPPYWRSPSEQRCIQVDLDPQMLGLNKPIDLAIQADARTFLRKLLERVRKENRPVPASRQARLLAYRAAVEEERAKLDQALGKETKGVHPAQVARACQEVFPEETSWVFDGGNTAIWAHFYHQARRPRSLFSTFKMGMLGAGVGQALGVKVARPQSPVCCIIGDGAMGMQQQEVETAVRVGLPVVYVVLCDRQWGMVKMNQQFMLKPLKAMLIRSLSSDETINADLGETQFDMLGRSMGAYGERVRETSALRPALRRAIASGKPAVIHVDVDKVEHMWAPGLLHFKAMHQEPAGESA